ncbi:hypothetical protein [Nonomuraea endophytica]|uniref:hypothetical protein n=1 Tax=Nonomuraea endophytica TaxID=714136 RepID=UPI0037CBB6C2
MPSFQDTFAQKQQSSLAPARVNEQLAPGLDPLLDLRQTFGNQAMRELVEAETQGAPMRGSGLLHADAVPGTKNAPAPQGPAPQTPAPQAPASPKPAPQAPASPRPAAPSGLALDRTRTRLGEVEQGTTATHMQVLLNAKIKAQEITSFSVKGVQGGSAAEVFLLMAIYRLGKRPRWGTEIDLVTAIGWPAKPADLPPQGLVTLRIDAQGAASAELVAAGGTPPVPQVTIVDGSARLTTEFGFAGVSGWNGRPDAAAEISIVLAALELLRRQAPQDVAALRGVELIRVSALGGETAGEYSPGSQTRTATLKLADRAFDTRNQVQFFGGGPGSPPVSAPFQTVLHEVGHAVSKELLRAAMEAKRSALSAQEAVRQTMATHSAGIEAALAEAKKRRKLQKFMNEQVVEQKKREEASTLADRRVGQATDALNATMVSPDIARPSKERAAAMKGQAATALTNALTAWQKLPDPEKKSSEDWVKALEATAAAITAFATDTVGVPGLEDVAIKSAADRNRRLDALRRPSPRHPAIALLQPAVQAQDAWLLAERILNRAELRTRRLQKFVDLVTTHKIPRFTEYAHTNWQVEPEEFFAEAYSLWLVDPHFLKTNWRVVYDFFQNGEYRK